MPRVSLDGLRRPTSQDHLCWQQVGGRIRSIDIKPVIARRSWFVVITHHGPDRVVIVSSSEIAIDNSHTAIFAPTTDNHS